MRILSEYNKLHITLFSGRRIRPRSEFHESHGKRQSDNRRRQEHSGRWLSCAQSRV
jgi:hypothetical protein